LAVIAGNDDKNFMEWGGEDGEDGQGITSRFNLPRALAIDRAGNMVVVDSLNNAIRKLNKEGTVVSTLAGSWLVQEGDEGADAGQFFADGQGENARFFKPWSVVLAANDELIVSDTGNHSIRVLTPQGAVRTLCGNGKAGFADGKGADARFNEPRGLALDPKGNLLVADFGNDAIRLVTMAGAVSTGILNSGIRYIKFWHSVRWNSISILFTN
jgi:DNA-binding beta-propeller fold protein YncE